MLCFLPGSCHCLPPKVRKTNDMSIADRPIVVKWDTEDGFTGMVPKEGIEPTRVLPRQILSLLRLPVPPLRHRPII